MAQIFDFEFLALDSGRLQGALERLLQAAKRAKAQFNLTNGDL
jgi:hypothetical protein